MSGLFGDIVAAFQIILVALGVLTILFALLIGLSKLTDLIPFPRKWLIVMGDGLGLALTLGIAWAWLLIIHSMI